MNPSRLPLSTRFALLFAGALGVTALAVYCLLSYLAGQQSERQAEKTVGLAGQVMSRLMKTRADSLQNQCAFVIEKTGLGQLATVRDRRTIDDSLRELLGALKVDAAAMVDRRGAILGGTQGLSLPKNIPLGKPWSGVVVVGGWPRLAVVAPIRDPASRELQGALLVCQNLDDRLAGELSETLHARISFVLNGKVVAASGRRGEGEIRSRAALSEDVLDGDLALEIGLPRQALLASYERERGLVLSIFVLAFALGLVLAVRLAQNLTRPLEEVISAAREVRAGSWPKPLTICSQKELGLLQAVFNDMTATLRENQLVTVQTLAAAVDARDAYTRGHSDRVAVYAKRLAESAGIDGELLERIHTIGTLHDVGKIAIPDAILLKPGPLMPDEREIMESHAVRSEEIIKNVPALASTLPGIRHHHERWDGRGYPDGLAGENIPLEARILAIADTFDAITSDRPYRRGRSFSQAVVEIERCAGVQFDPELAPHCAVLLDFDARSADEPLRRAA